MRIIHILLILPCFLALLQGAPMDNYLSHHHTTTDADEEKDERAIAIKTIVSVCYKLVNYFILFMYYQPLLNRIYNEFVKIFGNEENPPNDYYDIIETTTRRHHHHHHHHHRHHHHHHRHPNHHHPHHHRHHHQLRDQQEQNASELQDQIQTLNEDTDGFLTPNPNSNGDQQKKVYSNR